MTTEALFPAFHKISDRFCLVVGGGPIAQHKCEALLTCGAKVKVVAIRAIDSLQALNKSGHIALHLRPYQASDLQGASLVVAATDDAKVNHDIFMQASSRNIPINVVDQPDYCTFYFPAIVQRGPLQVAISTAGESPSFATRLKNELEAALPRESGSWLSELGSQRRMILRSFPPGEKRNAILKILSERSHPSCESNQLAEPERKMCGRAISPMTEQAQPGKVYLVGSGPGDPSLLTLRAATLLSTADVVLHDDLVSAEIRQMAGAKTRLLNVGKRCGAKDLTQEQLSSLLIIFAKAKMSVVRLKSGDPMIFGRAGEEITALRRAQIPFEIVPGITAAFAAAAAAGISLTDRRCASKLTLSAGIQAQTGEDSFHAEENSTTVFYMPGKDYDYISKRLLAQGHTYDLPCILVSCASRGGEGIVKTTLGELGNISPLPAPTILLTGWALEPEQLEVGISVYAEAIA